MAKTIWIEIMKKYYFTDNTREIKVTKRILKILHNKVKNNIYDIYIYDIIRSLRWGLGVFDNKNTKYKTKVSIEAKINAIDFSLEILQYLNILISTDIIEPRLDTKFRIIGLQDESDFDKKLNESDLIPISGEKQILTTKMKNAYLHLYNINYQEIINKYLNANFTYEKIVNETILYLETIWSNQYYQMIGNKISLMKFPSSISDNKILNYYCLFDNYSMMNDIDVLDDAFIEDRTVVMYGFSKEKSHDRKKKDREMKYDNTRQWTDKKTDLGHYCAHLVGGNIWTNIFPQKRDINQGKSKQGKIYREMERHIAKNCGIFFFSRPIYFDFSYRPYIVEFGYLNKNFEWKIEYFENV